MSQFVRKTLIATAIAGAMTFAGAAAHGELRALGHSL